MGRVGVGPGRASLGLCRAGPGRVARLYMYIYAPYTRGNEAMIMTLSFAGLHLRVGVYMALILSVCI